MTQHCHGIVIMAINVTIIITITTITTTIITITTTIITITTTIIITTIIITITRVTGVRDLTTGHDSTQPDNKAVLPVSASSQMVGDKIVIVVIFIDHILTEIIIYSSTDHFLAEVRGLQCSHSYAPNKWH